MSQDEHSVRLVVRSRTLSSADLAGRIGVDPDERWDRGDRRGRAGESAGLNYNSGLSSETLASVQIETLLRRLAPATTRLKAIAEMPDAEVTLSIGYFINEPQWQTTDDGFVVRGLGVALEPAEIAVLHQMGAAFDVDIYVGDPDDENVSEQDAHADS